MTTLEEHLALSQRAYAARDVQGALVNLAKAFAMDPFDTPALQLAYQMLPTIPNLVQITAPGERTPREMVALHAMALALAHDWSRAIEILFRLGADDPKTPYLLWADHWMNTHPSAQLLDMALVGPAMSKFADRFEDPIDSTSPWHENLTAGTAVVQRLASAFVGNRALRALHVKLLRRGKRYDEALALAAQTQQKDPYFGAMLAAWSYRDMERFDEAIAAFRQAHAAQADADILLDVGDIELDRGRFEQAIEVYRQVPTTSERYADWAQPSMIGAHLLATRDPGAAQQLLDLAKRGNRRAQELDSLVNAYGEVQPSPRDLVAGLVRDVSGHFRSQPGQGTPAQPAVLGVNITSIESPSVTLAFTLAAAAHRCHARLDLKAEKQAKPDPRWPLMTAIGRGDDAIYQRYPLWVFDGDKPRVNAPPPPPAIVEAVLGIASTPFDWNGWQQRAAQLGPSLRGQVGGLVCALVHPPLPRDPNADPIDWVWLWQLAIALVIARVDGGWSASERRGGLLAMVHGPIDWVISAAMPALGLVYAECPEARGELSQIFGALRQRVPDIGYACYRAPLEAITMRLPDIDEAGRRQAWSRLVKATRKPFT
jgi:tetratricopeptide (TPR) repeat protein